MRPGASPAACQNAQFALAPEAVIPASRLRRPFADPTLVGFILAACVALALMGVTQWLAWQERRAADWAIEGQEALQAISDTRAALVDVQNGHRGFTIEGTPEALQPYQRGTAAVELKAARLRALLRNTPEQQAYLAEFERLLPKRLATAAQIVEARRTGGFEAARQIVATGVPEKEMSALRGVLDAMDRQQETIFRARAEQQHRTLQRLATGVGAITFLLLPGLALLYAQIRRRRTAQDRLLESDERLRLMTQSVVGYALVMLDPSGRVQTWNAGAERILGYTASEALQQDLASFYPPEESRSGRPAADLQLAAAHGSHAVEEWRLRRDGSRFFATTLLNAIVAADGEVRGYAMVLRDLTERRRIDQEKARIASQLQSLAETLEAQVASRTQELRESNAELENTKLRLQQLSARMVEHQELERRRLAYELHEDMAQSMSAIRIDLVRAQRDANGGKALTDAIALLDALIAQTRDMVARLRPTMLDDLGLAEALEGELGYHTKRNGWQSHLDVEPQEFPMLPTKVATAFFRVGQEAITNAALHAKAQRVDVSLRARDQVIELTVQDDGSGFDVVQKLAEDDMENFGLAFMRERARQIGGTLEVTTGEGGRGVRVRLVAPLVA